jgi:DNA-binding transcriptional LysR family regulator
MFTLRHLEIFNAVAQSGNITAGAERLGISQPAVSRQIRELEARAGLVLLDRLPRGVTPTAAGRVVAEYASRARALERETFEALAALRGLETGELALGASTTIGSYLLPGVLARFHRLHPGVRLNLTVANTRQIQEGLTTYRLDIGLTEGLPGAPDLEATPFMDDELLPVCAPGWQAARPAIRSLARLAEEPWIAREEGSGTRAVADAAFTERKLVPHVRMTLGSTEAIKQMTIQGAGYALISPLAVTEELANGRLVRMPMKTPRIRRTLHLVRARDRAASPVVEAFARLLTGEASESTT